jgi:hypothetical protein
MTCDHAARNARAEAATGTGIANRGRAKRIPNPNHEVPFMSLHRPSLLVDSVAGSSSLVHSMAVPFSIVCSLALLAGCAAAPSASVGFDSQSRSDSRTDDGSSAPTAGVTNADSATPSQANDAGTSSTSGAESGPLASHDAWEPWTASTPTPVTTPAAMFAPRIDPERYGGLKGDWEFTIGGTGNNDKNFDAGGFALTGSLGLFLTDAFEASVRENASFASPSVFNGSTRVALDFNLFPGTSFRPVLGANVGYVYGDSVHDTWSAAPEAGFKLYLQKRAFLEALMEYQFFFNKDDSISSAFDDGQFVYTLVLGLDF